MGRTEERHQFLCRKPKLPAPNPHQRLLLNYRRYPRQDTAGGGVPDPSKERRWEQRLRSR